MKYKIQLSYYSFLEHNSGPGVYRITVANTGKYYIGSSKDVRKRIQQHMIAAKYNRHTITELNSCYSVFGKEGFSFELLCSSSINELLVLESMHQASADKDLLLKKQVVRRIKNIPSNKSIKSLQNTSGQIVEFTNISEFCRNNSLDIKSIGKVLNGDRNSHKGWYRIGETPVKIEKPAPTPKERGATKTLINPEGNTVVITNISAFCRDNGLNLGGFSDMLRGKQKTYKGWRLEGTKMPAATLPVSGVLNHIDGRSEEFNSITEICKKHDLTPSAVSRILSGELEQHKGWYKPGSNPKCYVFQHPAKGRYVHWNAAAFCKAQNLKYSYVQRVLSGERQTYNGWTAKRV